MADTMERFQKLDLIQRSLGIRHKLKVYESMKAPETHEEMSLTLLAKWELEDELRAIEDILAEDRKGNVTSKRSEIEQDFLRDGDILERKTPPSEDAEKAKKKK